jgi:uncharacterized protein (TIGR03435 family)
MLRIALSISATFLVAATFWIPFSVAQVNPPAKLQREVKFEILSLRPVKPGVVLSQNDRPAMNGYRATLSIWQTITLAYTDDDSVTWGATQIKNAPNWLGDFYDIDARVSQADLQAWQHQSSKQELLRSAMRAALQDRCKLAIHEEPSQAEMLELIVAKGGPRLKPAAPGATLPAGGAKLPSGGVAIGERPGGRTVWHYYSASMGDLVQFLKIISNRRSIYDKTGLTGRYDFTFQQISEPARGDEAIDNFPIDRLGLKLRPGRESRPILVIDHIEKPSAN